MDPKENGALTASIQDIVSLLELESRLLDVFLAKDIMTPTEHVTYCKSTERKGDKNRDFFHLLLGRGKTAFSVFVSALLSSQLAANRELGEKLAKKCKPWTYVSNPESKAIDPRKAYKSMSALAHKFTTAKDVFDPFSEDGDEGPIRAKMSCGHAVTPDSLTAWCRSLVDRNQLVLFCPAIVNQATRRQCGKEWPYEEVRQMALLNDSEMAYFERKLGQIRTALSRPPCNLDLLAILESSSKTIDLAGGKIKNVPAIRSCPNCGCLVEHNTKACKAMMCPRCGKTFCFACLLMNAECLRTSSHFSVCQKPVHPKQTTIASWNQQ